MIILTGNTFEHKETIKSFGGKWNGDARRWEIDGNVPPHTMDALKKCVGLFVTISDEKPKQPIKKGWSDSLLRRQFPTVHIDLSEDEDDTPSPRTSSGAINFQFDSLMHVVEFVENISPAIASETRNGRNEAWDTDIPHWHGTKDMSEALSLARKGWPEGVELAQDIVQHLTGENALERRMKYSVAGSTVNVGRMLSGNPAHMRQRPKQPGRKTITFYVEAFVTNNIPVKACITRAALIAAIVDVLEANGFSCEVVSCAHATHHGRKAYQVDTTLKRAGEPLNLNDLVFGLGHPSFFRRLIFAVLATDERLRQVWATMGIADSRFEHGDDDYIVRQIPYQRVREATNWKAIWNLCVTKKLPLEITIQE